MSKMSELITDHELTDNGVKVKVASRGSVTSDMSCLIIQYPENGTSPEDELLNQFYKDSVYADSSHTCHIELPDSAEECHIAQPD